MNDKRNEFPEFCYYEIPGGEDVLALLGTDYIQNYGYNEKGERSTRKHFHNLLEIGICRWGRGEVVIDCAGYPYETGNMVVIPKNVPHAIWNKSGEKSFWEFIYVNPAVFMEGRGIIEKREISRYLDLIELHPFFCKKSQAGFLAMEANLIMDQIRTQEYAYRQCITGLVHALLMEIVKINHGREQKLRANFAPRSDKTQKIAKALDYIEGHYSEKIKVTDIAKAAYISPTYLRKLFIDYCMMSPMQYLNYVRVSAACKLMRKSDDNINEVARKVGYDNLATFINNFKIYMNETPKQWK